MARPLRVLAVDHNRILCEGISVLIGMEPGLDLVASVGEADSAVRLYREQQPDLTLMDLDLPAHAGLDAIRLIRKIDADAWIIGLVTDECDECCHEAVKAGASNLVPKDLIGKMLIPIIHQGRHNGTSNSH